MDEPVSEAVRDFSRKASQSEPQNEVIRAIEVRLERHDEELETVRKQVTDWNTWLRFGDNFIDSEVEPLQKEGEKLVELWRQTCEHSTSGAEATWPKQSTVPSVETLGRAVHDAQQEWEAQKKGRFRKAKDRLFQFLETLDDHAFLFKFIPTGDKYVSLISGVVASMVKVSVNHRKIADGFSLALIEISCDVRCVQKKTEIFDSPDIRRLLVELYCQIFRFLCHALSWYTSARKRFKAALHQKFYDDTVQRMVSSIQRTVKQVRDTATSITQERIVKIGQTTRDTQSQISEISYAMKRLEDRMLDLRIAGNESRSDSSGVIQNKFEDIGDAMDSLGTRSIQTLSAIEEDVDHGRATMLQKRHGTTAPVPWLPASNSTADGHKASEDDMEATQGMEMPSSRFDMEQLVARLIPYVEDGRQQITNSLRGIARGQLPVEVLIPLKTWIKATESRMIWVEGPHSMTYGSDLSLAAMRICDISLEAGVPCVSVFIKPRYEFALGAERAMSRAEAATVALLYSVVYQLARLVPPEIEVSACLSSERFGLLDGSIGSAEVALEMIEALVAKAPPSMILVIDGIHLAEGRDTIPYLSNLMAMVRSQQKQRVSKICFTTEGNSAVLNRTIGVYERVDATRMAQGVGYIPGVSSISEM